MREFETREAALTSARELADGGNVEVLADDPSTLAAPDGDTPRSETGPTDRSSDGMNDPERPRTEQGGL